MPWARAMLTYRSITANAVNTISSWGLGASDVTLLNAPLFHTGGLNVFTAPLVLAGGTSVVCRAFDPGDVFVGTRERAPACERRAHVVTEDRGQRAVSHRGRQSQHVPDAIARAVRPQVIVKTDWRR
jgi:acyl-CoA synthetase (AMP-forming)/AMP-acid ligase II